MVIYAHCVVILVACYLLISVVPQDYEDENFMELLLREVAEGASEQENSLSQRIKAQYQEDPSSGYANNLMGVIAFQNNDFPTAAFHFRQVCETDGFKEFGYIRNYLSAQNAVDSSEAEKFITAALDKNPYAYHLWVVFANIATKKHLLSAQQQLENVDGFSVSFSVIDTAATVVYGLTLFPRSPELLLLRAVHYYLTSETSCAAQFLHDANQMRHLQHEYSKAQSGLYFTAAAQIFEYSGAQLPGSGSAKCLPQFQQHTVDNFQPIYSAINTAKGPGWDAINNSTDPTVLNSLVSSSMFKTSAHGKDVYLPSLHVGCSEHDRCVKSGFLVADGMDVVSTHFVTPVHDLSMLQSASFGLVYSSHTLEHLSHNNPPVTCASYPKSDRAVPGCYSEVDTALAEWRRVLAPGGTLLIAVPDINYLLGYFNDPSMTLQQRAVLQKFIYGGQTTEYDFHKTGFYYEYLHELLASHNFCNVTRVRDFSVFRDSSSLHFGPGRPISLNFHATACMESL